MHKLLAAGLVLVAATAVPAARPALAAQAGAAPAVVPAVADGFATGTTGGAAGPTVTVSTAADLARYAGANTPYTIMVSGRVQVGGMVTVVANKSILGVGTTAQITGGGLQLGTTTRPGNNVIIRNLTFSGASDDSISVTNGAHHVWIDHNEFLPAYDGSLDIKRKSSLVTVSWNHFRGTDKTMLLGHSDSYSEDIGHLLVTYHHNYFDGSNQRHPRVRFGEPVHVYNNYYRNVGEYGVASTENAGVVVEGNYFENVAHPCHSVSGYAESDPGRLVQRSNMFVGSGVCEAGGTVAEPSAYYAYRLDPAAAVPSLVTAGAGVTAAALPAAALPAAALPAADAAAGADGFATGTTGGAAGPTVTVDTTDELLDAIDTVGPMTIQVSGTIAITSKQGVRPNKTITGIGADPTISGGGLDFYRSFNVIVRNLTFVDAEDDAINVGQESHHIWIDHNTFRRPVDGSVDIVRGADYVTVSWNHFDGTDKSMLIGHSDGASSSDVGHLKVSIHHNWFDGSRQRHPRVRFGEPVHVYNNYFDGNALYGVAATMNAGVLVEGNYFAAVPYPCFSTSGYADSGPGRLVQRNNVFTASGPCEAGGAVTEPRTYYSYTLDPAASVPALVQAGAGAPDSAPT